MTNQATPVISGIEEQHSSRWRESVYVQQKKKENMPGGMRRTIHKLMQYTVLYCI